MAETPLSTHKSTPLCILYILQNLNKLNSSELNEDVILADLSCRTEIFDVTKNEDKNSDKNPSSENDDDNAPLESSIKDIVYAAATDSTLWQDSSPNAYAITQNPQRPTKKVSESKKKHQKQ
jgi:hypothetical protein